MFRSHLNPLNYLGSCALCSDPGDNGLDLCRPCLGDLPLNGFACRRCALPLPLPANPLLVGLCGRCLLTRPAFDRVISPYRYEVPCDFMVAQLKFAGKRYFARVMGALLATHLSRVLERMPDVIVPVPLHTDRLRQRGFNQSGQIATHIARQLACRQDSALLERTRNTAAQMELPARKRRQNVRAAFRVCKSVDAACIALVDDVVTTTSTANEIARVLKQAGAAEVQVWSFARAASQGVAVSG